MNLAPMNKRLKLVKYLTVNKSEMTAYKYLGVKHLKKFLIKGRCLNSIAKIFNHNNMCILKMTKFIKLSLH